MSLVNQPAILPGAFAAEGDKNTIPANNDGLSGLASIAKGFPQITQVPLAQGGQPPQRQDFNGIFNLFSQFLLYAQNGGVYAYNNTLDYQPPCIISYDGEFYSCVAENGPSTSAGVQAPTVATYWEKLVPDVAVMTGASASQAGAAGLAPAPAAGENDEFLRGDGTWQPISNMKGASSSAAGKAGLVPAPAQNQQNYFLTGGGIWRPVATTQQAKAGTDDAAPMTALKVKQAITAQVQGIPIGDVVYRPFLMDGYVKANGATVNRSDYPTLVQYANDNNLWTSSPASEPWKYGRGNGSTTMVLPDYRNRVIQGGDNASIKSAGLPNITGAFNMQGFNEVADGSSYSVSGAFYMQSTKKWEGRGGGAASRGVAFDASRSNALYGKANTVQPPAIVSIPQIKI